MNDKAKLLGYRPVYEPQGVATAALMSCARCGHVLGGMGGGCTMFCLPCTVIEVGEHLHQTSLSGSGE